VFSAAPFSVRVGVQVAPEDEVLEVLSVTLTLDAEGEPVPDRVTVEGTLLVAAEVGIVVIVTVEGVAFV
jgi:hypothetical protein